MAGAWDENEISKNSKGGTEISHRSLAANIPLELQEHFQIIPSRVREIKEDKIRIYQVHDLAHDPEISHLKNKSSRDRFHKIIFNTNWHLNDCVKELGIPQDSKIDIIETPVEPITYVPKSKDEVRLIYCSTPQRGLEILVPVFIELAKKYDNKIHLDVFSSFKIYGWEEMDQRHQPLYKKIQDHPRMTYHGFQPHEKVVECLQKAHILAYPCIWPESACRVLEEAMSAGLMAVHSNLAALSDTSGRLTLSYQYQDNPNEHANIFAQHLEYAINTVHQDEAQAYLSGFVKTYADMRFNLPGIAKKWENLMRSLLEQYPDAGARKEPEKQLFTYRS